MENLKLYFNAVGFTGNDLEAIVNAFEITISFLRLKLFSTWVHIFAFASAFIYLFAQAELFATVMPDFPVWDMAGFIGSTMWLIWLMIIGVGFILNKHTYKY